MSGLPLWASRLLFMWQLWCLLVQAAPAQPGALDPVLMTSVAPGPAEPRPSHQQTPPMNSFMAEDFESLLLNSEPSALPAEFPQETEAFPTPQESPAHQPEDTEAGEHSSTYEDTSAQSALSPDLDQSVQVSDGPFHQRPTSSENAVFSDQEKSSALPQLPMAGAEPPSVLPQGPALPPKTPRNHEVTVSSLELGEAQHPALPHLNIKLVHVGVLIEPRHPMKTKPPETEKEASGTRPTRMVKLPLKLGVPPKTPEKTELSSLQQRTLAQPASEGEAMQMQQTIALPQPPQENYFHSSPIQDEHPTFTEIMVPPLNLELTNTPRPTIEAENHPNLKDTTAPPRRPDVTLRHPEPGQAQQTTFSDMTLPPFLLERSIKPEPPLQAEHPTSRWQSAAPPRHTQVTLPQPESVQAQQQIFSDVRVPPVVLELTIKREAAEEAGHHPTMKKTTAPLKQAEVTFPNPEPVHTQQTTFPDVRVPPLNLEPTVTPEPTVEAEHARALQDTTAPPKQPLGTFLVPGQQVTSTEVTGHTAELGFIRTQQPETSESGPPVNEQSALMNICELCTCKNETLSCTGLSPKQRLHRVPVLDPQTHNGSFTILNFRGNAISYIGRDTWESYRWVEKLILSENNLRELHRGSFEGLLSLQYLDLSSNKIQLIKRNTFESMPFLQQINLHNNLIINVRLGTFQVWLGMQFLHKHNPLTTVEDSNLLNLPALRHSDMERTQVSLTTVESILLMALKLRKLIPPSHLACCLCQFRSSIEAVSKTVILHCDSDCPTHMQCDEELYLGNTKGSLMKVLQGREKHNSPELIIEPERASPVEEKGVSLTAFMNPLIKLSSREQEEVKVSKADWGTDHWGNQGTEAPGEEEEQESGELVAQVPGYGYKNKVILAALVIAVATMFMVIFCLMAICQRRTGEEGKEGRGFFSMFGHKERSAEHEMEEGGFQRRWPLWLWDMYCPLNDTHKANVEQNVSDEGELLEKMEEGESSMPSAKAAAKDSAAEEAAEESDA